MLSLAILYMLTLVYSIILCYIVEVSKSVAYASLVFLVKWAYEVIK